MMRTLLLIILISVISDQICSAQSTLERRSSHVQNAVHSKSLCQENISQVLVAGKSLAIFNLNLFKSLWTIGRTFTTCIAVDKLTYCAQTAIKLSAQIIGFTAAMNLDTIASMFKYIFYVVTSCIGIGKSVVFDFSIV